MWIRSWIPAILRMGIDQLIANVRSFRSDALVMATRRM